MEKSDKPLISVIMPVYNPGRFLEEAVEGILNQTYENIELICIDDQSADGSTELLKTMASEDKRIQLYENGQNRGAAFSRNRGIQVSRGEYLFFVDADDRFEADLIQKMAETAFRESADVVYVDYDVFKDGDQRVRDRRCPFYYFGDILNQYQSIEKSPLYYIINIQPAPYSRLYRKEFIQNNRLQFQDISCSNDVYFGVMTSFLATKAAHVEQHEYRIHVRQHDSIYRISNSRIPDNNFKAYYHVMKEMKKRGIWTKYAPFVWSRLLCNTVSELNVCGEKAGKQYYEFLRRTGFEELEMPLTDSSLYLDAPFDLLYQCFCTKTWESGWLGEFNWFEKWLELRRREVLDLFAELSKKEIRWGVWGAGRNGQALAEFMDQLLRQLDWVLVLNQTHFNFVHDLVERSGFHIILFSFELLVCYGVDRTKCLLKEGE